MKFHDAILKARKQRKWTQAELARRAGIHSNTVEGYFGLLKRGLYVTYHHVSEAHLQRSLSEFDFRYTNRTANGVEDHERVTKALGQIQGKRLTYRRINGAA